MRDTQNTTIVLLLVSAAVLGALLIGNYTAREAAGDTSVRGARYVMVPGAVGRDMDAVYVINVPAHQLNIYLYDTRTKVIVPLPPVNLRQAFAGRRGG